jgi:hypothetical protein
VNVRFGDDTVTAVQVKVYRVMGGDIWDREKGRAAEPFKHTFLAVRVSPSSRVKRLSSR